MIQSLGQKSATFDEGNHLLRGLYPLSGGGFMLNGDHPPLGNVLQALPVWLTLHPVVPEATQRMTAYNRVSDELLWSGVNDGPTMIRRARLVTVGLTIVLGLLLWHWGRRVHGSLGGLLALAAFVLSPEIIAHGRLTTTDLPHALGLFAFVYSLWLMARGATLAGTIRTGVCLGLALGMKHTTLMLIPLSLLYFVVGREVWRLDLGRALGRGLAVIGESSAPLRRLGFAVLTWGFVVALALVFVWGLYGFTVGPVGDAGVSLPAPDYLEGLLLRLETLKTERIFYLNGATSAEGWYSYFFFAFLYKTPLPVFALLGIAIVWLVTGRLQTSRKTKSLLLIIVPYLIAVVASRMNLGLRYLLPFQPLLFLGIGALARPLSRSARLRWVLAALVVWLAAGTIATHPHYLSYFNAAVPADSRRELLSDSSLDWGQDLPGLVAYQREHAIDVIRLGYFGTADPRAYGLELEVLPSYMRYRMRYKGPRKLVERGVVAVSVSLLQRGSLHPLADYYESLEEVTPVADIGGSILVYDFRSQPQR